MPAMYGRLVVSFLLLALSSTASALSQINWSGYRWNVKESGDSRIDPDGNFWSSSTESVSVDKDGDLHLRILYNEVKKRWTCSEILMDQGTLGYGTYQFLVRSPTGGYDPNLVIGLFTYGAPIPVNGVLMYNEIDIEFSRFRNISAPTEGKYTVQPLFGAPRTKFLNAPGQPTIHQFKWMPGRVEFKSFYGPLDKPRKWKPWFRYASRFAPMPSNDNVRINFWIAHGYEEPPANNLEAEFIVKAFRFFK